MKIMNHKVPTVTTMFVLVLAGTALAWGPGFDGPGDGPRPDRGKDCLLQNLPEDKRPAAEKIMDEFGKKQFVLGQNMRARRAELAALLVDPVANEQAIQKNLQQAGELRMQMDQGWVAFQTEIFKLTGQSCVLNGCGCGRGFEPALARGPGQEVDGEQRMTRRGRGAKCPRWDE